MSRVAVVTGASRGVGAALTAALARRGYSVAGCATTDTPAAGAELYRAVDIADATAVEEFADEIAARLGPIDLWINNAAVLGPVGPLRDVDHEEWERAVAVNLVGVVAGVRAFLPRRTQDASVLVNVASRAAVGPSPGLAAYGATKAAVVSLTRSVAEEEGGRGLRAYAVIPPSIDTDMQDVLLRQSPERFPGVRHARRRRAEGRIVPATVAAAMILSAVLDEEQHDVVLDLSGD